MTGYPAGKLLQSMAFNMMSPAFQSLVTGYRFAALPRGVRGVCFLCNPLCHIERKPISWFLSELHQHEAL